jgi:hypothetical protein
MESALTILGAIIAILTTIFVEYLRRPHLQLTIGTSEDQEYINRPAKHKRAIRLKVENLPLPKWAIWMSRNPALQCGGYITFHHIDGQNVFGRSMIIRWPDSPEPIPLIFQFNGKQAYIMDPARITFEQKKDVFPGESAIIDVACRYDNDEECYGWNNESYFSDPLWRNPSWKLSKGRYIVYITIVSSGQKCTGLFRLINDVGIKDFRLENALPQDYDNLRKVFR